MKKALFVCALLIPALLSKAQTPAWSQRMSATAMRLWPDSLPGGKWAYEQEVVLQGMQSVWQQTGEGDYFKKGAVFAVGDPWFYNEYPDGRKLPPQYENFKAANDLVKWLAHQIPPKP